jgi:hypothetical protein
MAHIEDRKENPMTTNLQAAALAQLDRCAEAITRELRHEPDPGFALAVLSSVARLTTDVYDTVGVEALATIGGNDGAHFECTRKDHP